MTTSTKPTTTQRGQTPTPLVNTNKDEQNIHSIHKGEQNSNDPNPATEPVSTAIQGHTNNPQVSNETNKDLFHTENNSTKDATLSDKVETIDQTSQGDGTSATSSAPTPGIEPSMSYTLTNPHTGHKDHEPPTIHPREKTDENKGTWQCTFNRSHRDMAAISEHDHGVEDTAQPNTPPQKPVPTPNKIQERGKEHKIRPTTIIVERVESSGIDSENNNNQTKTPAEHHAVLTPQQESKQTTPTALRPTHKTGGHSKKIITITITHQDLNNNEQPNTGTVHSTQQHNTHSPISTRKGCHGTLYRLSPLGRSNKPLQQKSICRTHGQSTPLTAADSAWELMQTRDPQGVDNFHQNLDGTLSLTTQDKPRCNYCKLPNHGRQNCTFRLRDLQSNIDRQTHPLKGSLLCTSARNYTPDSGRGNRSQMSTRLANERDQSGNPRFWQTQCGYIIYSIDNQPQCSYCGIPSHG